MSTPGNLDREQLARLAVVGLLVAAYAAVGAYMNLARRSEAVYTHFAYVPIVLAGIWWGRKGAGVAALLGAIILAFQLLGIAAGPLWHDLARVGFLLLAGFCVGMLSESAAAGRRAERLSEEKHRLMVEKSLIGILVYRHGDFRTLFVNTRMAEMLRYRPQEMAGMAVWRFLAPEDAPRVRALVAERKAQGFTDLHYECRLARSDGSALWADMLSSVAPYEGEEAVLVNAYDISDRKDSEATRRELADLARKQEDLLVHSTRLAELGEMSAAVAHDLNQPLTGIKTFASNALYMLEQNAGSPEDVKDNLRLITEQADRAARIINQMRGMTRKSERHLALLDLNAIIRESVEFLTPQLRLTGVETSLALADGLPKILGDRTRLEQVFLNLLTNARQAMEESENRFLTVRTLVVPGGTRPVVVEVQDTGKGFAAADTAKLFAPFYTTKKAGHGTGLGLTISQRIVKDHGGVVEARGEPGKGATFTLRLPLPRPEDLREAAK